MFFELLAEVYDLEIVLRYHLLGEFRYLDYSRISKVFPVHQLQPGKTRKSRRDTHGFISYNPNAIGQFDRLISAQLYGDVPVGPHVRGQIVDIFNYLDCDVLAW